MRIVSTLISPGTETAFLMALPNAAVAFPQYPGYSNAGVVEKAGEGFESIEVGDRVVSQKPHASHVIAREEEVLKVPEGVSYDEAPFFALGSIALQGVRKAAIELGDRVAVVGQGLIGLLALQLAKLSGGLPVIAVDLSDYRLGVSSRLGADYTVNPSREYVESKVYDVTDGRGAGVVIEATGRPEAILTALRLAARHGRVVLLGSTRGESTVNFYRDIHRKGLHVIGAHNSMRPRHESMHGFWTQRDDDELTLKLIEKGLLNTRGLAASKMSFWEAGEAYRKLIEAKDEVVGVIFDWEKWR